MNLVSKGRRTKNKIIDHFRNLGYQVENVECRTSYSCRDCFGADLCARNENETLWISCKSNKTNLSPGKKELKGKDMPYKIPPNTRLLVVIWEDYAKEPMIVEC